ncbi:hypothetical protein LOC67_05390 [Stieleria sp. JC731]|uniref:hypothetical protein n=1 Tax=Pirellulaceae TaxID=2691357 RepID=UPI001E2AC363|nr:hypothetical protein [Stieleria sp. JC731]MCC9599987.1 hypothetical protein [Stieleria sp. JC731]
MRRVIKIGGSLLLQPNLIEGFCRWHSLQSPADDYLIVGGGNLIEAIRELDALHNLPPDWIHWHCVDLLKSTHHWLADRLPSFDPIQTQEEFAAQKGRPHSCANMIVRVDSFYHQGVDANLPEDWRTTTDAIAGYLAKLLMAEEFVLLKSCDADGALSVAELAKRGIIDEALPMIADGLPKMRIINLAAQIKQ